MTRRIGSIENGCQRPRKKVTATYSDRNSNNTNRTIPSASGSSLLERSLKSEHNIRVCFDEIPTSMEITQKYEICVYKLTMPLILLLLASCGLLLCECNRDAFSVEISTLVLQGSTSVFTANGELSAQVGMWMNMQLLSNTTAFWILIAMLHFMTAKNKIQNQLMSAYNMLSAISKASPAGDGDSLVTSSQWASVTDLACDLQNGLVNYNEKRPCPCSNVHKMKVFKSGSPRDLLLCKKTNEPAASPNFDVASTVSTCNRYLLLLASFVEASHGFRLRLFNCICHVFESMLVKTYFNYGLALRKLTNCGKKSSALCSNRLAIMQERSEPTLMHDSRDDMFQDDVRNQQDETHQGRTDFCLDIEVNKKQASAHPQHPNIHVQRPRSPLEIHCPVAEEQSKRADHSSCTHNQLESPKPQSPKILDFIGDNHEQHPCPDITVRNLELFMVHNLTLAHLPQKLSKLVAGPNFDAACTTIESEAHRHLLASFSEWPHGIQLPPITFAAAGFSYTGVGDEVKCFACGLTLGKWAAGMCPLTAHIEKSAGLCDFIKRKCASAKSTTPGSLNLRTETDGATNDSAFKLSAAAGASVPWAAATGHKSAAASAAEPQDRFPDCHRQPLSLVPAWCLTCEPRDAEGQHNEQKSELVKSEAYRLSTFMNVWHHSHIVTPEDLAREGFYYTGVSDRAQCAFCQGVLRNWEAGDQVQEQHAQHFMYCRFVQGHDVGNVPIPFKPLQPKSEVLPTESEAPQDTLGIIRTAARNPDFAVESRRLATFVTWPVNNRAKPEVLVKAGFFYLGRADSVQCFYCGTTAMDWNDGSDPWTKHGKCSPTCGFLVHLKGQDFVRQFSGSLPSSSTAAQQKPSFAVDPREVRARMDSPKVRVLLSMEYPADLVREVVQKRLATVGYDHETSEDLLEDVFKVHDEKQRAAIQNTTSMHHLSAAQPEVVAGPWEGDIPAAEEARPAASASNSAVTVPEAGSVPGVRPPSVSNQRCEASAFPNKTQNPEEENRQLKMQLTCKICMDAVVGIVFLPCGHLVSCAECAPAMGKCPICRVDIRGTVRSIL